jgi:dienelactone hydrolase
LRIFHGEADDWLPIDQCRGYIDRLRDAGVAAELYAYPGAHHSFDGEHLPPEQAMPTGLSPRRCEFAEQGGAISDPATGAVASIEAPCVEGVTIGANPDARARAVADVLTLLDGVFSR